MIELRAVIVCVDCHDYLEHTLPWNRRHFEDTLIVTSLSDRKTYQLGLGWGADVYRTDAFYANGAIFNKWLALEEGLEYFGRFGWLALVDADTCWPRQIPLDFEIGNLYSPYRRMYSNPPIPNPDWWEKYPRHRYSKPKEFSGYTMIFHAHDQHLGKPPWHETNWKHAGGADTFFQRKWPAQNRIRPNWEVLHLGEPGQWTGRTAPFLNGSMPENVAGKRETLRQFMTGRRKYRNYDHEKLT